MPQTTRIWRVGRLQTWRINYSCGASRYSMRRQERLATHLLQRRSVGYCWTRVSLRKRLETICAAFSQQTFSGLLLDQAFLAGIGELSAR
ncbi:hypothetical protein KCP73_03775 [Salmonella enterica subsp. enterica]|nr:hypothetical protein KCP73_03775 [Salmonella enterica subsp. enterica]